MFRAPHIMEVHPSFPAETVAEFIAYAKAHPGRINMASAGTGTISHMAGELFAMMAGIALTHVPYRGAAPVVSGLLGGQVQVMFDNAASSTSHIRAGRLRALRVQRRTPTAMNDVDLIARIAAGAHRPYNVVEVGRVDVVVHNDRPAIVVGAGRYIHDRDRRRWSGQRLGRNGETASAAKASKSRIERRRLPRAVEHG